ncbi:hypothetical protein FRC17_003144, partial [Serendipita sp. 399]
MLTKTLVSAFCAIAFSASTLAHPHPHAGPSSDELIAFLHRRVENSGSSSAAAIEASSSTTSSASSSEATSPAQGGGEGGGAFSATKFPDVQAALAGNQRFRETRDAAAIQALVDNGQKPPFMMVACSDSRAPEATIFDSKPGTFFMERNIANQYKPGDENAQSVMAYGIHVLGVQHVVILGHYGCGGIAASIATPPKANINVASHIVNTWIGDIRTLYLTSDRAEIVEMRTKNLEIEAQGGTVEEPNIREPGFRALVEENVKQQVQRIAESSVMKNRFDEIITKLNTDGTPKPSTGEGEGERAGEEEEVTLRPVFVHGWVHDLETGEILDLNVSVGPAGFENFVPPENNNNEETPSATETASAPSETATATETVGEASSTPAAEGEATTSSSAAGGEETVSPPQNAVVAPEAEAEVEPTIPVSAN